MRYFSTSGIKLRRGTVLSAGLDLPYYDPEVEEVTVYPGERAKLPTGIHMEIKPGYVGFLDSRSSTSKLKLDLLCRTIDADYRGEVFTVFINNGQEPVTIKRGQYLFQVIELPIVLEAPDKVDSLEALSETIRGAGGFGHTDKLEGEK